MQFDERRYRPLSTVDLFDEAFDLYKKNFVLFLSIVAVVLVPSTVLSDIYALKLVNAMTGRFATGSTDPTQLFGALGDFAKQAATQYIWFYAVMLIPWTLAYLALTAAVSARYLNRPITVVQAYISGYRKIVPGVLSAIVFSILLNIGGLIAAIGILAPDIAPLFVVVGVLVELFASLIVLAKYPIFMGVVVNEKVRAFGSLSRSSSLTKGDSGRIFWTMICLSVLFLFVYSAVEGTLALLTGGIVQSSLLIVPALADNKLVADQIAEGLGGMLINPFMMTVVTLLYFDQRVRKEGYDMDILANRLGYAEVALDSNSVYAPALTASTNSTKARKK